VHAAQRQCIPGSSFHRGDTCHATLRVHYYFPLGTAFLIQPILVARQLVAFFLPDRTVISAATRWKYASGSVLVLKHCRYTARKRLPPRHSSMTAGYCTGRGAFKDLGWWQDMGRRRAFLRCQRTSLCKTIAGLRYLDGSYATVPRQAWLLTTHYSAQTRCLPASLPDYHAVPHYRDILFHAPWRTSPSEPSCTHCTLYRHLRDARGYALPQLLAIPTWFCFLFAGDMSMFRAADPSRLCVCSSMPLCRQT